jgi:hypothetical protein
VPSDRRLESAAYVVSAPHIEKLRARTEEKQRKKDEKVALRKAERVAAEAPPDDKRADDKRS